MLYGSHTYGSVTLGGSIGKAGVLQFLADILSRRNPITVGGNPTRFVELVNGQEIPLSWYEPSAETSRSEYYYNTRSNMLFKRVQTTNPLTRKKKFHWLAITEC